MFNEKYAFSNMLSLSAVQIFWIFKNSKIKICDYLQGSQRFLQSIMEAFA